MNKINLNKMMHTDIDSYFQSLWDENRAQWILGNVTEAIMNNGMPHPVDFCISTVARVSRQTKAPIKKIDDTVDQLKSLAADQFFYPEDSRHITLLGCTQRVPNQKVFTDDRIAKIQEVCARTLRDTEKLRMSLRGLGIAGNQVFIQVFPDGDKWAVLRARLEEPLKKSGESPISYPNKFPIHMNIMRITHTENAQLLKILSLIEKSRDLDIGYFEVSVIDLIITDFVLSYANTKTLSTYQLCSADSKR